ncbi:MAG: hybrid sensor histidine kinase/response regulator, partial [Candidatus Omnitrophica bacterium]|nr:hybrid sensor histidine kinase/response regulator [Candidatus Omnitrophota bacterium]
CKGLYLNIEMPDVLPNIPFDIDKMHQVFNNLIGNAIKFTEAGGITVTCINNVDQNHIQITVGDTGPGISEEDLEKLFQKFQQLGDPHQHSGGTGLGLAICKEIIHRHGGKIWAESTLGAGTLFRFVLPIAERRTVLS